MEGHPRASIGLLMGLIGYVALGLTAIRNATELWAVTAFGLCVLTFACAGVLAVARRGRARTAWAGMAIFGFVYLMTAFGDEIARPTLPTTAILDGLTAWSGRNDQPGFIEVRTTIGGTFRPRLVYLTQATSRHVPAGHFDLMAFYQIGHSFLAVMVGGLGALFGWWVGSEAERDSVN